MSSFSNKGGRDGACRRASSRKGHPETEAARETAGTRHSLLTREGPPALPA
ncbi:hypothetical protein WCP94_000097 (plasmid) [Bilophila wadsworthia]